MYICYHCDKNENYFTVHSLKFLEANNTSTSSSDNTSGIVSGELCQIITNNYIYIASMMIISLSPALFLQSSLAIMYMYMYPFPSPSLSHSMYFYYFLK